MDIVTDIAKDIYRRAALSHDKPPKRFDTMAKRLLGPRPIFYVPQSSVEAALALHRDERIIQIRESLSQPRRNFSIAKMLVRATLEDDTGYQAMSVVDRERLENEVAGWIVAPTSVFAPAMRATRENIRQLSFAFNITETACALRIGELRAEGSAVVTPVVVHRKGPLVAALRNDDDVRALASAAKPRAKRIRRVPCSDENGRTALLPLFEKAS